MRIIFVLYLVFSLSQFSACNSRQKQVQYNSLKPGMTTEQVPDRINANQNSKKIAVDIFVPGPGKINGDILVLPGWKFSRKRWHKETEILAVARKLGFRAVFPEMNISNYESRYFPESRIRWAHTPGGQWIRKIMLPYLQKKYGLFLKGGRNYIMGLSTGGRGVLLVSLQNPGLFTAGATLSGDCNQTKYTSDRLMIRTYGPYLKFKKRWETVDNPENSIADGNWSIPLYIGHGRKDRISPFDQSESLYRTLKKHYPKLKVVFHAVDGAGHDFKYWNSEVKPVLEFFYNTK